MLLLISFFFVKFIFLQKGKNEFTEWIDEAISKNHLIFYPYESFSDHKKIGNGASGTVHKAYNNHFRKYMALKSLTFNDFPPEKMIKQMVNEVN